jgi:hypothetical protein
VNKQCWSKSLLRIALVTTIPSLLSSPLVSAALADPVDLNPPVISSRSGPTGFISVPSAEPLADGQFTFSGFSSLAQAAHRNIGDDAGYVMNFGFLPRLEVGFGLNDPGSAEDLVGNAKLQLLQQVGPWPDISAGAFDIKSNSVRTTYFLGAGRHFWNNRANATIGILHGGFHGGYGGLQVGIIPHLAGVMEYDSRSVNYGVRTGFFHNQAVLGAEHVKRGWTFHVGFKLPIGIGENTPAKQALPTDHTSADNASAVQQIQGRLIHLGLENVSASITPGADPSVQIAYENRSFTHMEIDALANVLAAAAVYSPENVRTVLVTVLRDDLPIIELSCPLASYRDFMARKTTSSEFAHEISVRYVSREPTAPAGTTSVRHGDPSFGHADLFFRPGVRTALGSEQWAMAAAFLIRPELYVPVARGLDIDSSGSIPIGGTAGWKSSLSSTHPNFQQPSPQFDQIALNWSWRPRADILTRTSAGKFVGNRDGVFSEALYMPADTRFLWRATAGYLDRTDGGSQDATATGELRFYHAPLNLTLRAVGGQFLQGDTGVGFDLVRSFALTDLGFRFRDTSEGRMGLVFVRVPIGPSHLSQRPSLLRIRPADFFSYGQRSLLTRPNYAYIANLTGNEMDTGTLALTNMLDDGRMIPAYIIHALPDLRRVQPF